VLDDAHPIHARMADPNTKDHSDFLTEKTYDAFVKSHDVVLVNFFAPWCHWCRRLEPVWEHTAGEVKKREYKNTVTFARVDCVKEAGLCRRHMVRAYPTILTYQQGKTDLRKMYRGDRSTAAFLDYVEHLDYVAERIKSGNWDEAKDLQEVKKDPKGESEGCQVTGVLTLKRVPGSLVFTAHSEWHNFDRDMIDVSHAVNELSFGDLALRSPRMMPHTNALDGTVMDAMGKKSVTHHHYMKLVETVFAGVWRRPTSGAGGFMGLFGVIEQAYTYQYTKHSHSYATPENKVALYMYVPSRTAQFFKRPLRYAYGGAARGGGDNRTKNGVPSTVNSITINILYSTRYCTVSQHNNNTVYNNIQYHTSNSE
jgi:protein disulfide-isomerase-like protein